MKKTVVLLVVVLSCAACLTAENRHAFYLAPDGSATWAVTEEDVRADPAYLKRARRGETQIAAALRTVGATRVETTVVRAVPPYTVVNEARFDSAAWMLESFLEAIGFDAEAALRFDADRTTLTFRFGELTVTEAEGASEGGPVECLVEPVEQYRFVLTEGRFVETTGFRLEADETVAVMLDTDEVEGDAESDSAFYSMSWSTER